MPIERIVWLEMGRLICKAGLGTISENEQQLLDKWLAEDPERNKLLGKIEEELRVLADEEPVDAEAAWRRFSKMYGKRRTAGRSASRLAKYAAVIALPLLLAAAYLFVRGMFTPEPEITAYAPQSEVMLILDDGRQFGLNAEAQKIAITDNVEVNIDDNGIAYDISATGAPVHYNTVQVPQFGHYTMTLSDGSKVILNSDTRLRYPVPFEQDRREVWLSGEAFFDVAPDSGVPFTVHLDQGQVKVLGTSFNVNARGNGSDTEATLIKGSVECSNGTVARILTPGEQGIFDRHTGKITAQPADIRVITAWTRGQFYFKNETLGGIMDELAQWYDIEVSYSDPELMSQIFTLEINRYENLNKILDVLAKTERIKYSQSGQKITIHR